MWRAVILFCLFWSTGALSLAQGLSDAVSISAISISGNKVTRRSIMLRELPVREGQQMARDSLPHYLHAARLRLLNLGLFTTVAIQAQPDGATAVTWEIEVQERWYLIPSPIFRLADRNFNVWWDEMNRDLRRINVGLTLSDNNFRGNLESLSVTAQAGYTQQLAVDYVRPYLDHAQRHGIGFGASVTQSGELPYMTDSNKQRFARLPGNHIIRQYDAGITWIYRGNYAARHFITLAWHQAGISDTLLRLNGEYLGESRASLQYADLVYRFDYNGVDNWNYPMHGFKTVNHIILRKGLDGFGWQAQWKTETGIFRHLGGRLYGQAIFRGRLSLQNEVPYFLRSALGSRTDYVRGYEYYVIDGTHFGLLRFDLKYALLNHTFRDLGFRYLPELPLRLYPKLFVDAGIARNPDPGNSFLHDRMLYSAGIGLDIVSAYDFKLRLEAAVNHLGQYGLYLHLNSE